MQKFLRQLGAALAFVGLGGAAAANDMDISLYLGIQESPHSRIKGDYPGGGTFDQLIGWEGRSFENPPYYGVRWMWWQSETLGYGVEFTHTKVYAPDDEAAAAGFDTVELTDGLNILTANVQRRWPGQWGSGSVSPYVGGGIGLAIPHVDVETTGGGSKTFEYQITGPAARLYAGASYELSERWAVFGEYQFTYSSNNADLDGDGDLQTDIFTNALNFGLTFSF